MTALERDRVPAAAAYAGTAFVGLTALVVLAYYQHLLIDRTSATKAVPLVSWTFSIGLDIGSAVASLYWFFGTRALRTWGRWSSLCLLAVSATICALSWGFLAGWWWSPLGLIHPVVFGLMAKLLTLWQAQVAQDAAEDARLEAGHQLGAWLVAEREHLRAKSDRKRTTKARSPEETASRRPALAAGPSPVVQELSARRRVREWLLAERAAGRNPTGAEADTQFGLTGNARCGAKVLRALEEEGVATG